MSSVLSSNTGAAILWPHLLKSNLLFNEYLMYQTSSGFIEYSNTRSNVHRSMNFVYDPLMIPHNVQLHKLKNN